MGDMSVRFSSKAGTLIALQGKLKSASIPLSFSLTYAQWQQDCGVYLSNAIDMLPDFPWIVRSSCANEDTEITSNAGVFLSIPDVTGNFLEAAVEQVFASYGDKLNDKDEVLIQPMLGQVVRAGVAFSHDPNTCAPYRVINWSEGASTSVVTAGRGGRIWQQAATSKVNPPDKLRPVMTLLDELLEIFDGSPLDCEFAVTLDEMGERLWLLQVRPLVLAEPPESDELQQVRLQRIEHKVRQKMRPHPFLIGHRTVYGVMPDWNPAEIIGVRPRPLALSLYRELVTDSIWAYQRHNYGYRNLRSFPLMPHFFGLPYIDVRVSFNSFIPGDLDDKIADRLVDYYIDRLMQEPALHDKVEFDVVFSCYTLDLPDRIRTLELFGFTKSERLSIQKSLLRLTNRILHPEKGLWIEDVRKINVLNNRRAQIMRSSLPLIEKIFWLLEDAKRYGTLPFAGLARAGFIAVQMLRSLVQVGVLTQENADAFMADISTVSGQLATDRKRMCKAEFLAKYGHLRPGTYDILSRRYDEAPDLYFDWSDSEMVSAESCPNSDEHFSLTFDQMKALAGLLKQHALEIDPVGLLDFMKIAIEWRELAKFHFSRNLSDALVLIEKYGSQYGFDCEDLSYANVGVFRELNIGVSDPKQALHEAIREGKRRFSESLKTVLPPLIIRPEDVWGFELPQTEPNFITQKSVIAPTVEYSLVEGNNTVLKGKVVCIPNADPGFDWLFAYPIAGLITCWGGANSHMAIRAGELGLPAVIGAGEMLYQHCVQAECVLIDGAGRRVETLR